MQRLNLLFPYLFFGVIIAVVVLANVPRNTGDPETGDAAICQPCGMVVDSNTPLTATVEGRLLRFCSAVCREERLAQAPPNSDGAAARSAHRAVYDVVCHMESNAAWGIRAEHEGRTYHFCATRCRDLFLAAPDHYLQERCIVCATALAGRQAYPATYLGKTHALCSAEHRATFKADPAAYFIHTMWGIPLWMYYTSIAVVLVISFGVFDWLSRHSAAVLRIPRPLDPRPVLARCGTTLREAGARLAVVLHRRPHLQDDGDALILSLPVLQSTPQPVGAAHRPDRIDLLRITWINRAIRSRPFRFGLQFAVVALFAVIIAAGLLGNQNPALNIAPLLTWTIWWGLLPILILFAGKAWCYVCPWDAVAGWIEKLRLWRKNDEGLSYDWKWPRRIRNISIATILFVGLTWVELGFGVTMRPAVTAYLAIAMVLMAIVAVLLFERKSFCRYGCLVGRVSGLYAMFGATEIRARHAGVCASCHTKECVHGSATAYGCPTSLYPGGLKTNTYCIQCMECIQACPHDNLALNLRPWGADLAIEGKPRSDEAYLALLMLSITGFHGLTMTPAWQDMVDWIRTSASVGRVVGFSVGMAMIMMMPVAIYALLVAVSRWLGNRTAVQALGYREYFIRYAYALLPIALFYHIAHNLEHLLMEGPKVMALASDPFGWNWNLFGTAHWSVPPLISLSHLWVLQVFLVLVGHVYSLWAAQHTSRRLFGSAQSAFRSQVPMLLGMICFSVFSLWLLKQPMEMRSSAM